MPDLHTFSVRTAVAISALALTLTAVPVIAAEESPGLPASMVAGEIVLPEGSPPLADGTIRITIEDALRADEPSGVLASLTMVGTGAESPVPFALSVVPEVLESSEVVGPLDITLRVRIESADGSLLYVNDETIGPVTPTGPITDLEIPVVEADAQ